jgi:hypothetical protein
MSRVVMTSCAPLWFPLLVWLTASACVVAGEGITLRGRFLLHGDVPEARQLVVDKDVACCGQRPIESEVLVVGPDRGLQNVVVYIRDKAIPLPPADAPLPVVINIEGCRYKPHVTVVRTGQELIFRNNDPIYHGSNVACIENPAWSGLDDRKARDSVRKFQQPERIPVSVQCVIHPWMSAWVLVRPNPYACVSDANGDFEIANIPAGTWEVQFWHEKCGWIKEMTVGGVRKSVAKGRMKIEFGSEVEDLGEIVLDYGRLFEGKSEPSDGAESR